MNNFRQIRSRIFTPVVAAMVCVFAADSLHAQGTRLLRGRVVDVQGDPVRNVRLRVVGHGEPEVLSSGEFEIQLSGTPSQVEVTLIDGKGREILYPLKGLLAVPANTTTRVPIVIGKSERALINDVLATRVAQLTSTLDKNGVKVDSSLDNLSGSIRRIIDLLEIKEADMRANIDAQKHQAEIKPELLRTWDNYLLEVKDLRDAFRLVVNYAARNLGAVQALQESVAAYNSAFTALNNNRNAFQGNITAYWSDTDAAGLSRDLAEAYTQAIERVHKGHVLPLNESFIVLQRAHGNSNKPSGQEIANAVTEADRAVRQLDIEIPVLEEKYARLRSALERN
jgi:hypothetical protein